MDGQTELLYQITRDNNHV